LVQERALRNPPAYWALNVRMVVLGTRESRLGPAAVGGWEAMPAYNRRTREVVRAAERQSERVVVLRGREGRLHGEGPALHRCTGRMRGTLMSAESARSVSRAKGVDRVRALQRVLYRCAKQDRDRRFHAVYDKVARSDVLWQAWGEVRANRGAPGVDGITIDVVVACGVGDFLDELAARLRAGTYRPRPLRRVHIPKPGRPGQLRPLGIPCIADRVVMAAAKIVLEPIFGKRRTTGMREGNERVLHRRPSESRWPRPCVGDPRGRSEALESGCTQAGYGASKWFLIGVPTRSKTSEGNIAGGVIASRQRTPRGLRTRCMRAISPC
jgi:hypothetical protein